ncbi:MAG: LacI family DNA-binding transcriptional regulator [Planctomycetes bacterium]|nr:LacI family DNA-binding transcriptional regulator [Planctomycetota bacterium]
MARTNGKQSAVERKPVSIRDVADASGVSLTTVSLILNNGDQRISEPTRARVLTAIERLGYRPNRLAQGLQNRRSNILAILVPHLRHTFADPYFGELISGIYDRANRSGYKILLEAAGRSFLREKRYLDLFDRCFVDGMLFMGSTDEHRFLHRFRDRKRPFILVNNTWPGLDHVVADYRAAGRLAAEHLVGLGHRRIGMIHGAGDVETARLLIAGFAETLAQHGVELPASCMEDGFYTEEGGAAAAEKLITANPSLTAIFTGNDKMAAGAIQRLQALGRRVPSDVSVVGCDDITQAAFVTPSLTTIRTPLYELGRRSCQRLIERLRGKDEPCQEVLPVELTVRQSTAPAAS